MKTLFIISFLLVCGIYHVVFGQTEWQNKANRILAGECKAVTYKGKIYVSSFNSENHFVMEEYNPSTDTWVLKKAISETSNFGEYCIASTEQGIYIMGGYQNNTPSNQMIKYDAEKDTFYILENMPTALDCATAISVNNQIYVMCGSPSNSVQSSNKVYHYNPVTAEWTEKQAAPVNRREAQAVVINNKIYLFGGFGSTNSNKMNIYDPATNEWTTGKNDIASNRYLISMGVANNKIYLIAGIFANNAVISEELFQYNPETDLTVKISNLSSVTWLMGTASMNQSVYYIGGIKGVFPTGEKQNSLLLFSIKADNQTGYREIPTNPIDCSFDKQTRKINITTKSPYQDNLNVSVYSLSGKQYLNRQFNSFATMPSINTNSLIPGIYIVSVKSDHFRKSFKIPID